MRDFFISGVKLLLFVLLVSGCHYVSDESVAESRILVNPELAVEALLYEACDSVFWIPLQIPDSLIWADIRNVKAYNQYIILPDAQYSKSFSVFDTLGGFIGQLNKRGKGPGEYLLPYSFTYCQETNELVVNDRMRGYFVYSLPDLKFKRHVFENVELKNAIEGFGNKLLVVEEANSHIENRRGMGLYLYDMDSREYSSRNLAQSKRSNGVSKGNVFTTYQNGSVLYAHPYTQTVVYRLTEEENIPLCVVDFGEHAMPEKFWIDDDLDEFWKFLREEERAYWVQDLIWRDDRFLFEYYYRKLFIGHLVSHHWKTGITDIYSSLRLWEGGPVMPSPVGVYRDFFMVLLHPEDFQERLDSEEKDPVSQYLQLIRPKAVFMDFPNREGSGPGAELFEQIRRSPHPVLVMFRLK